MTEYYTPEFVETFPTPMLPEVFYISLEYHTCAHLCACGCGNEVITPLSPAQWSFTYDGRDISVCPSVGNWTLPCRSHYVIERGQVEWVRPYTDAEVARNRSRDRSALARMDKGGGSEAQRPYSRVDAGQRAAVETNSKPDNALARLGRWFQRRRRRSRRW